MLTTNFCTPPSRVGWIVFKIHGDALPENTVKVHSVMIEFAHQFQMVFGFVSSGASFQDWFNHVLKKTETFSPDEDDLSQVRECSLVIDTLNDRMAIKHHERVPEYFQKKKLACKPPVV
ncbi:uncharacterized protein PHALS_00427 [Plasmopara halstedii]|uniref:Uncharacterized protein n=1 Tax=Plasmopara halstedii TaxID=4781 RepID=A0A0P1A766_PLAHL|nr:uncharacterized protein PHALS_00427 [Plasmopara halstedii]CEG36108.1 hypothetical protein PHALS_00427 [Plasmopara halstedii]|eukprot:XP_024572477.1 hypothetical protein PHALS_00427 [Plasmopara halstedii]